MYTIQESINILNKYANNSIYPWFNFEYLGDDKVYSARAEKKIKIPNNKTKFEYFLSSFILSEAIRIIELENKTDNNSSIESKLDRIIDLLEDIHLYQRGSR